MDDDFKPKSRTEYGRLEGFDPVVTVVHRGDPVRFVNVDDIHHRATGYAFGAGQIPAHFQTSATGTFYYADAYHPTQMRGAIVVK